MDERAHHRTRLMSAVGAQTLRAQTVRPFAAAGGEVNFLKGDGYEAWVRANEPAIAHWKAKVGRTGIDGDKLIAAKGWWQIHQPRAQQSGAPLPALPCPHGRL
jgi:hypothetical protein